MTDQEIIQATYDRWGKYWESDMGPEMNLVPNWESDQYKDGAVIQYRVEHMPGRGGVVVGRYRNVVHEVKI